MNKKIQIRIIDLIDDGATIESSSDLRELINSSDEAKSFYESMLVSESAVKNFFGGKKARELSNKIDAYVDEQFNSTSKVISINFKPIVGFAIAASMAAISFTFFNTASQTSQTTEIPHLEQQIVDVEEVEPIFISGEEMVNGLWGPSSKLAREIGRDRYEIMYAVYEANKDNFVDNDINQPKQDKTFFVDLSLVENLDKSFVIDEVKRHIFCSC
tara:strand:+ start:2087 stop:2731 length:645 start_codon:yes stop_codon:yes gene_type:complete